MDKYSMAISDTAISGHIGGQLLNHLCYADNMCLISVSLRQACNCIMETSHTHCV